MSKDDENEIVVTSVKKQIKKKLLDDFHKSLKDTEADARKKHAPFTEKHRLEIMLGFGEGCLAAAAEVMKQSGISYLFWLTRAACAGSRVRSVMSQGEDQLHQLFHKLVLAFPDGEMPETVVIGGPIGDPEFFKALTGLDPNVEPEEKDLN